VLLPLLLLPLLRRRRLLPILLLQPRPWLHSGSGCRGSGALPCLLRRWPAGHAAWRPCADRLSSGGGAAGCCNGIGQRACHRGRVQPSCQCQRLHVLVNIQGSKLAAAVLPKQVGQRLRAAAGHQAVWYTRLRGSELLQRLARTKAEAGVVRIQTD
jgi:hypothetical protein